MLKTEAEIEAQEQQISRVSAYALDICREAELRGLDVRAVLASICSVSAARNPQFTGEIMGAVMDAIRMQPVTKIVAAEGQPLQ